MANLHEAIAVSLYLYNMPPAAIAKKIYDHFEGACMDMQDLVEFFAHNGGSATRRVHWATELPIETAAVLLEHALERYESEARNRASYLKE